MIKSAEMKAVSSHDSANTLPRDSAMFALLDWLKMVVNLKAENFRTTPTHQNLTSWCNAAEVLADRNIG